MTHYAVRLCCNFVSEAKAFQRNNPVVRGVLQGCKELRQLYLDGTPVVLWCTHWMQAIGRLMRRSLTLLSTLSGTANAEEATKRLSVVRGVLQGCKELRQLYLDRASRHHGKYA